MKVFIPFHLYHPHWDSTKINTTCGRVQLLSANTGISSFAKLSVPVILLKQSPLHFYRLIQVKRKDIKIANGDCEVGGGFYWTLTQHKGMFCFVQLKVSANTRGISQRVFKSWSKKTRHPPSDLHTRSTIKILVAKYQIQISHLFSIQAHMPLPSSLSRSVSLRLFAFLRLRGAQSLLLHCNQSLFCPRCNLIAPACRPPQNIREEDSDLARLGVSTNSGGEPGDFDRLLLSPSRKSRYAWRIAASVGKLRAWDGQTRDSSCTSW